MYEELYESLPDANQYWARLGMVRPQAPLTVTDLDRIIFAHQCSIPFENLDVCDFHKPVSLGIADLFNKIIVGTRGGYCFELNALFDALLQDAGLRTMPCLGRSLKDRGYRQPIMHRGIVVELDGMRYLADVGYGGPMPSRAIPLVDGVELESRGQLFRVEYHGSSWWHILYCGSEAKRTAAAARGAEVPLEPVLAVLDAPQDPVDFVPLSHFCSTHPNSVFTQWRMVNLRTPDGNLAITGDRFTKVSGAQKKTQVIKSEDEFRALLKQHFGIVLPDVPKGV